MILGKFIEDVRSKLPSFVKLYYRAFGNYKTKILALIGLGFFSSFVEAIGVSAVIPLLSFLIGTSSGDDLISRTVEKSFGYFHIPFTLRYILVFIVVLFLFRAVSLLISNYLRIKITADYEKITRVDLFKKALRADWPYLLKQKLGHLETILMLNISHGERLLNSLSSIITILTGLVMYTVVALNISFYVTIVTVLLGLFLVIIVRPIINRTYRLSRDVEEANRKVTHHVNENIVGMKTVKSMQVGRQILDIGKEYFELLRKLKVKITFLRLIPVSLMQPLGLIFVVVVFAFSYKSSDFHLAALVAVIYLIQRIFLFVEQLQSQMHILGESTPFLAETMRYEKEFDKYREILEGTLPFVFEKEIGFKDIQFSYVGRESILENVSFVIPRGSMIGLIGPSGSGKTTIVDLLLRMFKPSKGTLTVDGENIEAINLEDWRKNIGYVTQDIFLMNDTIENNIRFYNEDLSFDEIERAAKMADIFDFINGLPQGFNTFVGERGVMLSSGQRQRIIVARVLARKPKILILDEATSALDNESELQIQNVIEKLRGELTVVIVAHRLSTIINTDKIIVLEGGRIIEEGIPRELLKEKDSYFFKTYNLTK